MMQFALTRTGLIFLMQSIVLLALMIFPVAHAQERPHERKDLTAGDVKREAGEAADTTGDYISDKKEQYLAKTEALIHRFESRIKRLYQRAESSGSRAKEKLSKAAERMRQKNEAAKEKLKELKAAGDEKWTSFRNEMDSIMQNIDSTYRRTISKFHVADEKNTGNKEER